MQNILVIGSLNTDMVIHMKEIPRVGQTVMGKLQGYVPGGKGANQAYAAAKLGKGVSMLGKVGDDDLGKQLIDNLSNVGVDVSKISCQSGEVSGLAVIYVNEQGNNSIVVLPAANSTCDVNFIAENEQIISKSKIILIQLEIPLEAAYFAIHLAHKNGCTVILNPAPAPDSIPDDVLKMVDYLTPNETELEKLAGTPVIDIDTARNAAKILLKKGTKNVIATLGREGAILANNESSKIFKVEDIEVVDTTAAGDTFNAAVAVGLSENMSIDDAIIFANKAARICVSRNGAQSSIPSRAEVV